MPRIGTVSVVPKERTIVETTIHTDWPITVYGNREDLLGLVETEVIRYQSIDMDLERGTVLWWSVAHNDKVAVGMMNTALNFLTGSFVNMTVGVFDPGTGEWTKIIVRTTEDLIGVVSPAEGYGAGTTADVCVIDGRVVFTVAMDYRDWRISTNGIYPVWLVLNEDMTDIDYERSKTINELKTSVMVGDPEASFPISVNGFGELFVVNQALNEAETLPNGWMVSCQYFPIGGTDSGSLIVFDEDGAQRGFYRLPDMTLASGDAVGAYPRDVTVDRTFTDPTDMRFIISVDAQVLSDLSRPPFWFQEFAFNATTGDIIPMCAPILPTVADQAETDAGIDDYNGSTMMTHVDAQGTVWVSTAPIQTFSCLSICAWVKSGGERRWVAEAPPSGGWESDVGGVWVQPDFIFDGTGMGLPAAWYEDELSGGMVLGDHEAKYRPLIPDSPLVARANLNTNDFSANVTGWSGLGFSSAIAWNAGDGGRLEQTSAGGGQTSVIHLGSSFTSGTPLDPVADIGQHYWGWVTYKAASTLRAVRAELAFLDDDGNFLGYSPGPQVWEQAGTYVKAHAVAEVPAGSTQVKLFCRVLDASQPPGEIHYVDSAYLGLAPATIIDDLTARASLLPLGICQGRWMAKGTVDGDRRAWSAMTQFPADATGQPLAMPQYLVSLDLAQVFDQ